MGCNGDKMVLGAIGNLSHEVCRQNEGSIFKDGMYFLFLEKNIFQSFLLGKRQI